jgi:hypothetical protein
VQRPYSSFCRLVNPAQTGPQPGNFTGSAATPEPGQSSASSGPAVNDCGNRNAWVARAVGKRWVRRLMPPAAHCATWIGVEAPLAK